MTPERIKEIMDGVKEYAEALGELRRLLVDEQGFIPEVADQIVVEAVKDVTEYNKG